MEDVVKFITVGVAACFVASATFLFGQFVGLNHLDLAWYLTFSDFVNMTPPTVMLFGVAILWTQINDINAVRAFSTTNTSKQHRNLKIVLGLLALFALLIVVAVVTRTVALGAVLYIGFFWVVLFVIGLHIKAPLTEAFGAKIAAGFDRYLLILIGCVAAGWASAPSLSDNSTTYTIRTSDRGPVLAHVVMPLERGLALVRENGFQIIPWDNVKSLDSERTAIKSGTPQPSKPSQSTTP
jgi:hypothetical protein